MMSEWFNTHYGSRRGFVDTKWHQFKYILGRYKEYTVTWQEIDRLVFVCTGNICRSAFAEAVAKTCGMKAISVGVHAIEGAGAEHTAIRIGRDMGYNLSNHHTTPVMYPQYTKNDLFLAMEPWQAELVRYNLAEQYPTTLLGLWGKPVRPCIQDPFMRSDTYFKTCFKYIENTVHAIAEKKRPKI